MSSVIQSHGLCRLYGALVNCESVFQVSEAVVYNEFHFVSLPVSVDFVSGFFHDRVFVLRVE